MASVKPGPKTPDKYNKVGPNYQKWGELLYAGYVYNPETDKYYYDPKAAYEYEVQAKKELEDKYGEKDKTPSAFEQAAAASLPAVIGAGSKYLFSQDGRDWMSGLLGLGKDSSVSTTPVILTPDTGKGLLSTIGDYGEDAFDAVVDWGGDAIDVIGDYGGDFIDWIGSLF